MMVTYETKGRTRISQFGWYIADLQDFVFVFVFCFAIVGCHPVDDKFLFLGVWGWFGRLIDSRPTSGLARLLYHDE
jgi:hypothetical protein